MAENYSQETEKNKANKVNFLSLLYRDALKKYHLQHDVTLCIVVLPSAPSVRYFLIFSFIFIFNPVRSNSDYLYEMEDSQNQFTRELYLTLARSSDENLLFSPFCISTALSMVYIGSKANTEKEIRSVMHLPSEKSSVTKAYHEIISDYKKELTGYEMSTANLAYISNKFSVLDEYVAALTNEFLSHVKLVDFAETESARTEINKVIENETHSKIKNLIPSGSLSDMARLVLVNAIHFKGSWKHQFDLSKTKEAPFWISANKYVHVPMMTIKKYFKVARMHELDCTLLAMDYQDGRMSFIIILPNERDGLQKVEEKLSLVEIRSLKNDAHLINIEVTIPKFKLEESLKLIPFLQSMGITDLFSEENCDLSDITGKKDLFVSDVLHKAFLEVNEEGSEAAAATESTVRLKRSLDIDEEFVADHPFVFLIYDNTSSTILFIGRFSSPISSERTLKDEL